jgi:ABC-type sugar transport system substrate-binding protein
VDSSGISHLRVRAGRIAAVVLVAALAAVLVAACGSSSTTGGGSGGGGAKLNAQAKTGLTKAETIDKQFTTRPTEIGLTQKITNPIPTGKTIYYVHCGVTSCDIMANAMKAAASELGWTLKVLYSDGTPQGAAAAWTQAVNAHPAGIIGNGLPATLFAPELKKAKAEGIPVVEASVTDPAGSGTGIDDVIASPGVSAKIGDAMASEAVTISNGGGQILYANLAGLPILVDMNTEFDKDMKAWCPNCSLATINIPLSALGSTATNTIVSYLRSHTDVHTLVIGQAQITVGLPAALKAAGLSDVKIVDESPGSESFTYIEAGQQDATVFYPFKEVAWGLVDALARKLSGTPIEQMNPPFWTVTKANSSGVTDNSPVVTNYKQQFLALWGK